MSESAVQTVPVTLVLPCLNEEKGVGDCVSMALKTFADAGLDGRVIVVDNGSTDRSAHVAMNAGATVIHQAVPGYGAALRTGIEAAPDGVVVMADADGTYELSALARLVSPVLEDSADLVLGARLKSATGTTMPFLHRFVGTPVLSWIVNRAAGGIEVSDSQSGFRAFRREKMLGLGLTGTGMEFASEMIVCAGWANWRIAEIDTTYSERVGESKLDTFSDGIRHLRQLLILSPDVFAVYPGIVMTAMAVVGWFLSAFVSSHTSQVGSLGWLCLLIAGVFSVIGPVTYAVGMMLRYRAVALGVRHKAGGITLDQLVRRLCWTGIGLLVAVTAMIGLIIVNYHVSDPFLNLSLIHI